MSSVSVIPFGPQHSSFLEPMNLKLYLEEEKVVGATINIGYNHRGMEYAMAQDSRGRCSSVSGVRHLFLPPFIGIYPGIENAFNVKVATGPIWSAPS